MGMHHGILAADMPWQALLKSLASITGRFLPEGPVMRVEDVDLGPIDDGFRLLAGTLDGRAYVLDTSMMLSLAGQDALAAIARDTGALVIGCGAETVSGSYSFFAARGPGTLRFYNHCHSAVSQPFESGRPLPTETLSPFSDLDGMSFQNALSHYGFEYNAWLARGTKELYLYTADELKSESKDSLVLKGPIASAVDEHFTRHALARDQVPPLMVVARDSNTGQVISQTSTGVSLSGPSVKKSLLRRLRDHFS